MESKTALEDVRVNKLASKLVFQTGIKTLTHRSVLNMSQFANHTQMLDELVILFINMQIRTFRLGTELTTEVSGGCTLGG